MTPMSPEAAPPPIQRRTGRAATPRDLRGRSPFALAGAA